MKNVIIIAVLAVLFGCQKKDNSVVPDSITYKIYNQAKRDGIYSKGLDSVRYTYIPVDTMQSTLVFYSNQEGFATVSLKKDNAYMLYVVTPTYFVETTPYSYRKLPIWLVPNRTLDGKNLIYDKNQITVFYEDERQSYHGWSSVYRPDIWE